MEMLPFYGVGALSNHLIQLWDRRVNPQKPPGFMANNETSGFFCRYGFYLEMRRGSAYII
jgi:hypothetical protein